MLKHRMAATADAQAPDQAQAREAEQQSQVGSDLKVVSSKTKTKRNKTEAPAKNLT